METIHILLHAHCAHHSLWRHVLHANPNVTKISHWVIPYHKTCLNLTLGRSHILTELGQIVETGKNCVMQHSKNITTCGRGSCTRTPWTRGSSSYLLTWRTTSASGDSSGKVMLNDWNPTSSQALFLLRTYVSESVRDPTKTTARPGTFPTDFFICSTSLEISQRISWAIAFPSMMFAAGSVTVTACTHGHHPPDPKHQHPSLMQTNWFFQSVIHQHTKVACKMGQHLNTWTLIIWKCPKISEQLNEESGQNPKPNA